jgi:hypothetical protein
LRDAGTQIDAIFFTGELVAPDACAGTTPAYVYEYLLRPLLQAASLPGARFYLVPGSRAQGGTAVAAGRAGFSFFSAGDHATAEQRGLYKNIHAVFHGNSHTGDSSSLMKSLAILFKSSPASLYGGPEQRAAYALLEYDAEAAGAQWTVALREFDEAGKAFELSVLYTPNGQESAERDAEYVFSTLLPRLAADGVYLDGLLGKRESCSMPGPCSCSKMSWNALPATIAPSRAGTCRRGNGWRPCMRRACCCRPTARWCLPTIISAPISWRSALKPRSA